MRKNSKFPKSDAALFNALRETLNILGEEIEEIPQLIGQRPHRAKVVAVILRQLVCDGKNNNGGLLAYFLKKFDLRKYKALQTWLDQECVSARSGSDKGEKEWSLTTRGVILEECQRRGLAHEDIGIQHTVSLLLDFGTTERSNLRFGMFLRYGAIVLEYGKDFVATVLATSKVTKL